MSIWTGLFSRRNVKLSNRDDAETLRQALSMAGSAAGKAITIDTVLQLSTAWSCIRLLSETIGTLPLGLFERDGDAKKPANDDPLYELLHNSPNADQTAAEFWEGAVACLCGWGNAYAEKSRTGPAAGNRVTALTPLKPDLMTVTRRNGRRRYLYSDPTRGQLELDEDQVFHLRGFGFGGDVGLSPVSYARQTMGIALAADETAAATFANGLQNSGFIHLPVGMKPPTRVQKEELIDFFAKFAGSSLAGKMLPLDPGMEFKSLGINPDDAQLLQSRAFNVEEICRWFRVPPFMVGHTEKSTSWGTGLEQQMIGFLTFSLRPYLTRIEQAVRKQLVAPGDRARLFAEFNLEGLLRADSQGRAAIYSTFAQNGISTRNEMRALENRPPMPGGDQLTVQSNLVPLDQLGAVATDPANQALSGLKAWLQADGPATASDAAIEAAVRRILAEAAA